MDTGENVSCENHESPLSQHDKVILNAIFNPNLPFTEAEKEESFKETVEEETESLKEAKRLEIEGVKAAENGNTMLSLEFFNQAIALEDSRASGYNNRAQALRLMNDVKGALEDLQKAISLSGGRGKAACQAYTQRGLIHKLEKDDDLALEDFKKAANLGSAFAKQMAIEMNPYAALCNKMLAEMIGKVQRGEPEGL